MVGSDRGTMVPPALDISLGSHHVVACGNGCRLSPPALVIPQRVVLPDHHHLAIGSPNHHSNTLMHPLHPNAPLTPRWSDPFHSL